MIRPELYFDTQVIRDAADGVIADASWKRTSDHVARKFRHRISPVTLYELLSDIASAAEGDFERYRERVRRLFVAKKNKYLRLPRHFAAERLFADTRTMQNMEPDDFDVWGRVVLAAADKNTLTAGVSMKEDPRMRYRLDLDEIDKHLKDGQDDNEQARKANGQVPDGRASLADSLQRLLWHEPDESGRARTEQSLNAALEFNTASNDGGPNAWLRTLQLFYLCDPEIILVTSDAKVLSSAKNSAQSERIWSYDRLRHESGISE